MFFGLGEKLGERLGKYIKEKLDHNKIPDKSSTKNIIPNRANITKKINIIKEKEKKDKEKEGDPDKFLEENLKKLPTQKSSPILSSLIYKDGLKNYIRPNKENLFVSTIWKIQKGKWNDQIMTDLFASLNLSKEDLKQLLTADTSNSKLFRAFLLILHDPNKIHDFAQKAIFMWDKIEEKIKEPNKPSKKKTKGISVKVLLRNIVEATFSSSSTIIDNIPKKNALSKIINLSRKEKNKSYREENIDTKIIYNLDSSNISSLLDAIKKNLNKGNDNKIEKNIIELLKRINLKNNKIDKIKILNYLFKDISKKNKLLNLAKKLNNLLEISKKYNIDLDTLLNLSNNIEKAATKNDNENLKINLKKLLHLLSKSKISNHSMIAATIINNLNLPDKQQIKKILEEIQREYKKQEEKHKKQIEKERNEQVNNIYNKLAHLLKSNHDPNKIKDIINKLLSSSSLNNDLLSQLIDYLKNPAYILYAIDKIYNEDYGKLKDTKNYLEKYFPQYKNLLLPTYLKNIGLDEKKVTKIIGLITVLQTSKDKQRQKEIIDKLKNTAGKDLAYKLIHIFTNIDPNKLSDKDFKQIDKKHNELKKYKKEINQLINEELTKIKKLLNIYRNNSNVTQILNNRLQTLQAYKKIANTTSDIKKLNDLKAKIENLENIETAINNYLTLNIINQSNGTNVEDITRDLSKTEEGRKILEQYYATQLIFAKNEAERKLILQEITNNMYLSDTFKKQVILEFSSENIPYSSPFETTKYISSSTLFLLNNFQNKNIEIFNLPASILEQIKFKYNYSNGLIKIKNLFFDPSLPEDKKEFQASSIKEANLKLLTAYLRKQDFVDLQQLFIENPLHLDEVVSLLGVDITKPLSLKDFKTIIKNLSLKLLHKLYNLNKEINDPLLKIYTKKFIKDIQLNPDNITHYENILKFIANNLSKYYKYFPEYDLLNNIIKLDYFTKDLHLFKKFAHHLVNVSTISK